ncbi:hypothetical protein CASFOL_001224 [Castilleja foliolosa]|uniref:Replication factor A C-terminal domain-containing protein n=1 Tax=Castilleja foliolosa TaxID=1961234 RepID=A0ABD3ELZ3_9LAMI
MALFSLLSQINSSNTNWGVRARLIRLYKQPSFTNKDELGSLEMVLHDEVGDRIHATLRAPLYERIGKDLTEGKLYIFRNFIVVDNMSTFKTTHHRHKINLFRKSVIREFQDENFPSFMYNFTEFEQLAPQNQPDARYLIDVIGRVNRQLSCTLWAEYINDLLPYLENSNDDEPVIVAIQFARIHQFRDQDVKVANTFHVTKVTVNEDNDVFKAFKKKLSINDTGDFKMVTSSNYDIYDDLANGKAKFRTLAYLNDHQDDDTYWVDATIVDIQTPRDCWYLACKKCAKRMIEVEEVPQICEFCGFENPMKIFRYKLDVMVVDSTGSAVFLLWNKACASLIGQTAAEMKESHGDCSNAIPKVIEDAVLDKRVLFEVRGSSFKTFKGSANYTVSRLAYDDEIMELYTRIYTGNEDTTTDEHGNMTEMSSNSNSAENMDSNKNKLEKGKEKCSPEVDQEPNNGVQINDEDVEAVNNETNDAPVKRTNETLINANTDPVKTFKRRQVVVKKEK